MGLFDRSKQITETVTNITTISDDSTRVVQDSNNVITSITDAFKTSFSGFNTTISQPIGIQAGGGSGEASFDFGNFFSSANEVPSLSVKGSGSSTSKSGINTLFVIAVMGLLAYLFLKRK